jgi:hypothetical protein
VFHSTWIESLFTGTFWGEFARAARKKKPGSPGASVACVSAYIAAFDTRGEENPDRLVAVTLIPYPVLGSRPLIVKAVFDVVNVLL